MQQAHIKGLQAAFMLFYFGSRQSRKWFYDVCQGVLLDTDKNVLPVYPGHLRSLPEVYFFSLLAKLKKHHKCLLVTGIGGVKNDSVVFASVIDPCLWILFLYCTEMSCRDF